MQQQTSTNEKNYHHGRSVFPAAAGYFIAGTGLGAALALLFAPKPGKELREDIVAKTQAGIDTARQTAVEIQHRTGELVDSVKKNALALTDIWKSPEQDMSSSPDGSTREGIERMENETRGGNGKHTARKPSNIV